MIDFFSTKKVQERVVVRGERAISGRRRKNVIWRRIEGRCKEEREERLNRIVERVLGKKETIEKIRERRRKEGGKIIIVGFYDEKNAKGILKSRGKVRLCWGVRVDKYLTMRERRSR